MGLTWRICTGIGITVVVSGRPQLLADVSISLLSHAFWSLSPLLTAHSSSAHRESRLRNSIQLLRWEYRWHRRYLWDSAAISAVGVMMCPCTQQTSLPLSRPTIIELQLLSALR